MNERNTSPRWDLILPVVAVLIGGLTVSLAFLAVHVSRERDALALDGRVLGLGHDAEQVLREKGTASARETLERMLNEGEREIRGIALKDAEGNILDSVGSLAPDLPSRSIDVFIGPSQRGPSGPPGPPGERGSQREPGTRPRGRGRLTVQFHLDPNAGTLPLPLRLLAPSISVVGVILVGLAILGGRLLVRQQEAATREAQRRRLEALARAGAGLAHQLRTPLATIKGSCQLIGEQLQESPMLGRLEATVGQVARMERMLGMLLDYARPPSPQPDDVEIGELVRSITKERHGVTTTAENVVARVDPDHLAQIIDNLLENAMTYASGEPVEISVSVHQRECVLVVADRGPGPGTNPEELFEPYYTTRASGTGLGLAIARNLAEANGGSLQLSPRPGRGCEAVLRIPLHGARR